LTTGPDGSCALCRRAESARPRPARLSPIGALLGLVAIACVSAIGYTALRRAIASPETALSAESSGPSQDPAPSTEPEQEPAETPESEHAESQKPANEQPQPDLFPDAAAIFDTPTATPAPSPSTTELAAIASAPAPKPSAPQPNRAAVAERLRAAMQLVPVTIYTTDWCKHCERARTFLRANSIPFVERDVEKSESAGRMAKALNPAGGVPTIDIDGQVLVGFDEASVLRALVSASQRRMR
jgi:glutaredoxin